VGGDGGDRRLADLRVPLLVIHGSADPLIPHRHGVALAEAVQGATLVTIEGGGHELDERHWDQMLDAIARHTGA
jgi:pimeloyl-ACP methyl ester carboxylesterase